MARQGSTVAPMSRWEWSDLVEEELRVAGHGKRRSTPMSTPRGELCTGSWGVSAHANGHVAGEFLSMACAERA
ncbi:unnamed protein product [Urochloa humidicola]